MKDLVNIISGEPAMYLFTDESFLRTKKDIVESHRAVYPVAKAVFGEEMTDFRYLSSDHLVQQSSYANGVTVTVNFGTKPYRMNSGAILKGEDWHIRK